MKKFVSLLFALLLFVSPVWAGTTTETFTHADQVGDLSADNLWTRLAGTPGHDWGIVTNQGAISGNASSGSDYRMNVQANATGLITIIVTRISQAGGGGTGLFGQFGIYLSDGTTQNNYACYSVIPSNAAPTNYTIGKTVTGTFTSLNQTNQALAANDVMKFTVNQATGDLNCLVNNISVVTANDTALTGLTYANLNGFTNDTGFAVVVDNLSLAETGIPFRSLMGVGQ